MTVATAIKPNPRIDNKSHNNRLRHGRVCRTVSQLGAPTPAADMLVAYRNNSRKQQCCNLEGFLGTAAVGNVHWLI